MSDLEGEDPNLATHDDDRESILVPWSMPSYTPSLFTIHDLGCPRLGQVINNLPFPFFLFYYHKDAYFNILS